MPQDDFCYQVFLLSFWEPFRKSDFFFSFLFLGLHPQHMEVPRVWVELELHLLAYTSATAMWDLNHICDLHCSSRQCWILNPLSKTRD